MSEDALSRGVDRRSQRLKGELAKQRLRAGDLLAVGTGHDREGARPLLRHLTETALVSYLHNKGKNIGMTNEEFTKMAKGALDYTDIAIKQLDEAAVYYPTWEEAYLMRAEAYRCRAGAYAPWPGLENSGTEKHIIEELKKSSYRRALADTDQVLRFWKPSYAELGKCPESGIKDAYGTVQVIEFEQLYKNIYAKAWLQRGVLRAALNRLNGRGYDQPYDFIADFETSKKIDPFDPNLYIQWARVLWQAEEFEQASEMYKEGIRQCSEEWYSLKVQNMENAPRAVSMRTKVKTNRMLGPSMDQACDFMREEHQLLQTQKAAYDNAKGSSCAIM